MVNKPSLNIQQILFDSLSLTDDGVGIFDENDVLIYCNKGLAALFGIAAELAVDMTFSELIENCFNGPHGINIESDDLEQWLQYALSKRRSCSFRTFEVDTQDGHWYLITEKIVHECYIYVYITDITEKKQNEQRLKLLSKKLQKLASTDSLTGICNRRSYYELTEIELKRSQRHNQPFVLLVIDLDNFKQVNDNFGHAGGDVVLKAFVDNTLALLRSYDIFGRIGGEEFAILLAETTDSEALIIAERIRNAVESMTINFEGNIIKITASIGLSTHSEKLKSIDDIIKEADKNLYKAKGGGRNQIHQLAPALASKKESF